MSMSSLETLPNDLFALVVDLVSSNDIYRLWKSGSSHIQLKLRYTVRHFDIWTRGSTELNWMPRIIYQFIHLSSVFISHDLDATVEASVGPFELLRGIQLEALDIEILHPQLLFSPQPALNSTTRPIKLKELLPCLRNLKIRVLRTLDSSFTLKDNWEDFPASLETIEILGIVSRYIPSLPTLFPSLKSLKASFRSVSSPALSKADLLPPSLTDVQLRLGHFIKLEHLFTCCHGVLSLRSHLPNLRILTGDFCALTAESLSFDLPSTFPSLETMSIPQGCPMALLERLPNTLTTLHLPNQPLPNLIAFIRSLPRSLRTLTIPIHEEQGQELDFWKALPPGLTQLYVWSFRGSIRFFNDAEVDAFPKTLTDTNIYTAGVWNSSRSMRDALPHLRKLHLTWSVQSDQDQQALCLFDLPIHLTSIISDFGYSALVPTMDLKPLASLKEVQLELELNRAGSSGYSLHRLDHILPQNVRSFTLLSPSVLKLLDPTTRDEYRLPFELAFNSPESSSNSSSTEYFHQLSTLKVLVRSDMVIGSQLWPSSLRSIELESHIHLSHFLAVCPPLLAHLHCKTFRLNDEDIIKLPRQLTHLSIRTNGRAGYHPDSLRFLPPLLFYLTLPSSKFETSHLSYVSSISKEEAIAMLPHNLNKFRICDLDLSSATPFWMLAFYEREANRRLQASKSFKTMVETPIHRVPTR